MKGLLYDVVKGNKSNTFYIVSALLATVLNVVLCFGVTVNPNASVSNEFLCVLIGLVTPMFHLALLVVAVYLLYIMYRVVSYDIVYERANDFIEKEYAVKKRIKLLKIPHFVYAQYEEGLINIYAYTEDDELMQMYQTNCYVEFLKEVNPKALRKIKRGVKLREVF